MLQSIHTKAGRVTIATILFSIAAIFFVFLLDIQHGGRIQTVAADTATTSVTVLNIPPVWTVEAVENPASATTTPTNVGSAVTWNATGTDGNGEPYYLLICKTSGAPTPHKEIAEGGTPECNGGATNLWAVSTSTTSGQPATAAYTVLGTDVQETYHWYAFICDSNEGTPTCNATYSGHESTADNKTPFSVNHAPSFDAYSFAGAIYPDGIAIWNATSTDTDDDGGADTVKLYVCRTQAFTVGGGCTGGEWATSSYAVSPHLASTTVAAPVQDGSYNAYGYIVDEHGLVGTGAIQSSDAPLIILNATPMVSNVAFASSTLELLVEQSETTGFTLLYDVTDDNSCVANGSTTAEILSGDMNTYRSGVGSTSCMVSGDYDPNDCYTGTVDTSIWNVSCSQVGGSCLGPTDDTAQWRCTFPLWYVADPTETGNVGTESPYALQTWLATAFAVDDDNATSSLSESDIADATEVEQFLSFSVGTTSIAYGSFQPDDGNATTEKITTMYATGNTGLDQNLYGDDMCPGYPTCSGLAASTIFAPSQHFATSTVSYALGFPLATTTQELEINQQKTSSTTNPTVSSTYWGIWIPTDLTLSGDYIGVNWIEGRVAETGDW